MNFDWVDYISLADDLLNFPKKNEQSYLRAATSRAYYCAFCKARDFIGFKDYEEYDVHRKVIDAFISEGKTKYSQIGKKLKELKRDRIFADYRSDHIFNLENTRKRLNIAKDILSLLENI
jgi:uncharacterized protein (UPF0332 family)